MFELTPSSHPALWLTQDSFLSYRQLIDEIDRTSFRLHSLGISSQSSVGFLAYPKVSVVILFFSLLQLGCRICPISFRLPILEIQTRCKKASLSHFINPDNLTLETLGHISSLPCRSILLFTSASQGSAKLACLNIENFLYNALGSSSYLPLKDDCCWLLSLPLFHVSGLSILFRCFSKGASIKIPNASIQEELIAFPYTHVSLVPTQIKRHLQSKHRFSSSLKAILVGGAPIPHDIYKKCIDLELPLFTTYGLTEMASQVTTKKISATDSLTLGPPLPFGELCLAEDGEILVKGRTLFQGYVEQNHITLPLDENGWFGTKDLGILTKEEELIFKGRKDNMFISGGENIHPEEVEKALYSLPSVLHAIVVPIEDTEFGQRPIAFLQTESGSFDLTQIQDLLAPLLPKYAIPITLYPFPKEATDPDFKINRGFFKNLSVKK